MRPAFRRLVTSALFGTLFAILPLAAMLILSCLGRQSCSPMSADFELGLAYFVTGSIGWMLFASFGRQRWPRVLVLGFIAGAFAPAALWGWIWMFLDPEAPHEMGMVTPFIYLLEWIQPVMILIALAASALAGRAQVRIFPASAWEADEASRTSMGEAIGYGVLIVTTLLLIRAIAGRDLGLQMVNEIAYWSAAALVPAVVWFCVFWRHHRIDWSGMGLVVLASFSVIMLVAVSGPTVSDEDEFRTVWMVPGQVAYWGWTNLIETGWLVIPVMALSTLLYGHLVTRRRQWRNHLTAESAHDSIKL